MLGRRLEGGAEGCLLGEEMQGDHYYGGPDDNKETLQLQAHASETHDASGPRNGKPLRFRAEKVERSPFKDHEESHRGYKEVDVGGIAYRIEYEEIDNESQEPQHACSHHETGPKFHDVGHNQVEADVCADHVKVALSKIGDIHDAEYYRESRGEEYIDASLGNAVDQVLGEFDQAAPRFCGNPPGLAPARPGPDLRVPPRQRSSSGPANLCGSSGPPGHPPLMVGRSSIDQHP